MLILRCCIWSIQESWNHIKNLKIPESRQQNLRVAGPKLYLWIIISTKKKELTKLLSISLPSSFSGYLGVTKYHTVWATFSRYFLLDAFSLGCAIRIRYIAKCLLQCHSRFLENHLYSFIVKITRFMLTEFTSFSRATMHPSSIDLWILLLLPEC